MNNGLSTVYRPMSIVTKRNWHRYRCRQTGPFISYVMQRRDVMIRSFKNLQTIILIPIIFLNGLS